MLKKRIDCVCLTEFLVVDKVSIGEMTSHQLGGPCIQNFLSVAHAIKLFTARKYQARVSATAIHFHLVLIFASMAHRNERNN